VGEGGRGGEGLPRAAIPAQEAATGDAGEECVVGRVDDGAAGGGRRREVKRVVLPDEPAFLGGEGDGVARGFGTADVAEGEGGGGDFRNERMVDGATGGGVG